MRYKWLWWWWWPCRADFLSLTLPLYRRPHPFWTSQNIVSEERGLCTETWDSRFSLSAVHLLISTDAAKSSGPVGRSVLSGQKHNFVHCWMVICSYHPLTTRLSFVIVTSHWALAPFLFPLSFRLAILSQSASKFSFWVVLVIITVMIIVFVGRRFGFSWKCTLSLVCWLSCF